MKRKNIIIASLVAIIAVSATYVFWPEEAPTGEIHIDPAAKTAKLFDRMIGGARFLAYSVVDTRTVINGHKVPPMPDMVENNKTIAGIDTDHNGIRDDIDRYIAEKWGDDPRYQDVVYQQQMQERALIEQTPQARDRESDALACALPFKLTDKDFQILAKRMSELTHQVLNTPARRGAYGMVMAGANLGTCPHRQ